MHIARLQGPNIGGGKPKISLVSCGADNAVWWAVSTLKDALFFVPYN